MKNLLSLILLSCFLNTHAQTIEDKDYILLNQVMANLLYVSSKDTITLYENTAIFVNQETVFTKPFFTDYTFPVLGVDNTKIRKLIKILDFDYLAKQKKATVKWEFDKIEQPLKVWYEADLNEIFKMPYRRLYSISQPLYSRDGKMAFIYYYHNCGIDCGETVLKIYKKQKNGKWCFYTQLPLSIS